MFFLIQSISSRNCENYFTIFKIFFHFDKIWKKNAYNENIFRIIFEHFYNLDPDEFFEFICNFVIILDILYLIIITKEALNSSKEIHNEKEIINKKINNNNNKKSKAKFLIEQIESNIKSTSIGGNKIITQNNKIGIDNNQIKQEIHKFKKAIEKLKK